MEVNGQLQAPANLLQGKKPGSNWTGGCVGPTADKSFVSTQFGIKLNGLRRLRRRLYLFEFCIFFFVFTAHVWHSDG
jgi:hypothetical protein